jgi:hypothetical protein
MEKQLHILSVYVALAIQHDCGLSYPAWTTHMPYYIVFHGLSGSTIFFHIIS